MPKIYKQLSDLTEDMKNQLDRETFEALRKTSNYSGHSSGGLSEIDIPTMKEMDIAEKFYAKLNKPQPDPPKSWWRSGGTRRKRRSKKSRRRRR